MNLDAAANNAIALALTLADLVKVQEVMIKVLSNAHVSPQPFGTKYRLQLLDEVALTTEEVRLLRTVNIG